MSSNVRGRVPTKAIFVEELLTRQPGANLDEANEAWQRRGNKDRLSRSLFYRVKARVAAPGTGHAAQTKTPEKSTTPAASERQPHTSTRSASHGSSLDQLETQIDDLMFKAREAGGLRDVEEALRQARRLLVRSQSS